MSKQQLATAFITLLLLLFAVKEENSVKLQEPLLEGFFMPEVLHGLGGPIRKDKGCLQAAGITHSH